MACHLVAVKNYRSPLSPFIGNELVEKSKPVERRGRKAQDLFNIGSQVAYYSVGYLSLFVGSLSFCLHVIVICITHPDTHDAPVIP